MSEEQANQINPEKKIRKKKRASVSANEEEIKATIEKQQQFEEQEEESPTTTKPNNSNDDVDNEDVEKLQNDEENVVVDNDSNNVTSPNSKKKKKKTMRKKSIEKPIEEEEETNDVEQQQQENNEEENNEEDANNNTQTSTTATSTTSTATTQQVPKTRVRAFTDFFGPRKSLSLAPSTSSSNNSNATTTTHLSSIHPSIKPDYEGWLSRKEGVMRAWKRRYFRKYHTRLLFYDDNRPGREENGVIVLAPGEKVIESESDLTFSIVSGPSTLVTLKAENSTELQEWTTRLKDTARAITPPITPSESVTSSSNVSRTESSSSAKAKISPEYHTTTAPQKAERISSYGDVSKTANNNNNNGDFVQNNASSMEEENPETAVSRTHLDSNSHAGDLVLGLFKNGSVYVQEIRSVPNQQIINNKFSILLSPNTLASSFNVRIISSSRQILEKMFIDPTPQSTGGLVEHFLRRKQQVKIVQKDEKTLSGKIHSLLAADQFLLETESSVDSPQYNVVHFATIKTISAVSDSKAQSSSSSQTPLDLESTDLRLDISLDPSSEDDRKDLLLELTYALKSSSIDWKVQYTAIIDSDFSKLHFGVNVSLDNASRARYENARLFFYETELGRRATPSADSNNNNNNNYMSEERSGSYSNSTKMKISSISKSPVRNRRGSNENLEFGGATDQLTMLSKVRSSNKSNLKNQQQIPSSNYASFPFRRQVTVRSGDLEHLEEEQHLNWISTLISHSVKKLTLVTCTTETFNGQLNDFPTRSPSVSYSVPVIQFRNSSELGLGFRLPTGALSVLRREAPFGVFPLYVLPRTTSPYEVGQLINLPIGAVDRDVFATRKQSSFNHDKRQNTLTETIEITVVNNRNHRLSSVTVQDNIYRWNQFKVVSSEPKQEQSDEQDKLLFSLTNIQPKEKRKITYTVLYSNLEESEKNEK